jgi:Zn-dependent protease with chaperone function
VALVLFMLALPVFTFVAAPLASLYSRRHEFEADAYAAKNASASALVAALVKLYQDNANTLTPDPLPTLQPIPVTLLAGTEDAVVAPSSTEALAKILSRCGAQVEVHWQKAGHELTPEDFASVKQALIKMIF